MVKRRYLKPALSTVELIAFLARKGLRFSDMASAAKRLEYIGYYRLKIYTRPFEDENKNFKEDISFDDIAKLYEFDRKLRLICMDAIERLEIALRARIINVLCEAGGPHFYYREDFFDNEKPVTKLRNLAENGSHLSITHYKSQYSSPYLPPIWCLAEASTLGHISTLFSSIKKLHRKEISLFFGVDQQILISWFRCITNLRNICAHHGRLWNAELITNMPVIAKKFKEDLENNKSFYSRMALIRILLNEIDKSYSNDWCNQLKFHIDTRPLDFLSQMGFPTNWHDREIWN